jgi:hypothetical protein
VIRQVRSWLAGLRPRLVAAFAVIMILGATAAAGASYVSARNAILKGIQDQTMLKLRDQIVAYLPTVSLPPSQATLDAFASALKPSGALVVYHDLYSSSGMSPDQVPADLRQAVATSTYTQFQRVDAHGFPQFYVGIPVQTSSGTTTGLEVYAGASLDQQQAAIDELARQAWLVSALALPFAVGVALLAARRGWEIGSENAAVVADLPAGITAALDRRRLDIVVANLVGNALRHGAPPVEVVLRAEGGDIVLTVTDHGPGIADEVLPRVFDRFAKADTARARSEGSGLGLSIARENARLHGGDIVAANTGTGARFELRLPRAAGIGEAR